MEKKKICKFSNAKVMVLCTTDNMIWQFLIPHVNNLISLGAKVDCVCSRTGFWFDELRDKFGFNMIEIPMERSPLKIKNFKAYKELKNLQKINKYDIIYCQQPVGGMLGRLLGKKFKLPVIYTAHGFFFFKGNNPIKNFIFKSAEKYLSKYTDVLITMNEEDYKACQNWKHPKKYKISGIGINPNKYADLEAFDKKQFKQELGLNANDKVILSVSEFIKRKNYPTMLKTFQSLQKTHSDVKYVVCGTGVLFDEMKTLAKELKIEDKVLFLGYRKDINKIMQIADIFYHQAFQEGLTMSIMEAMHFGLPVVTSNVRGNQDLIEDGKGGFLTEPEDILKQVEALNILLKNKELSAQMGSYNNKKVELYYLNNVQKELQNIYKENGLL